MESAEAHAVHTPMEDVRYSLVGHTSRCFDVCYNRDSSCILSGGEDGTAKMWTVPSAGAQGYTASPKLLHSLLHNKEAEVLRVSMGSKHDDDGDGRLYTGGSDGKVLMWGLPSAEGHTQPVSTIALGESSQVYALEPLGGGSLLVGFEDRIAVYDASQAEPRLVNSTAFTSSSASDGGFGGARNPENCAFVFDAKCSPRQASQVAVALSDGTVRITDLRSAGCTDSVLLSRQQSDESFVIALSAGDTHATQVAWSPGGLLAVSLGSGHSCLFDLRMPGVELLALVHSCRGSCYGGLFLDEALLVTWGGTSVKLWDVGGGGSGGGARSIVDSVAEKTLEGYPVYNCALSGTDGCLAAAGGGTRQGFLGCPLYVLSPFG